MGILGKVVDYFTSDGTGKLPPKIGRNEPCHCGSGMKYKKCCFEKDERVRYDASMSRCSGST